MNVAANQQKKKNEETKTRNREAGEERKRATDFKEAVCCPSAVVQGATRQENGLCKGSVWGNRDLPEGQQSFQPNPNGVWDRITTLRRLLIGAALSHR